MEHLVTSTSVFRAAIYCPPLKKPDNGELTPTRCGEKKHNKFNDTCSVTCSPGYTPDDPAGQTTTCLENGKWKKPLITGCKRKLFIIRKLLERYSFVIIYHDVFSFVLFVVVILKTRWGGLING